MRMGETSCSTGSCYNDIINYSTFCNQQELMKAPAYLFIQSKIFRGGVPMGSAISINARTIISSYEGKEVGVASNSPAELASPAVADTGAENSEWPCIL